MLAPRLPAATFDHVGIVTNATVLTARRWADLYGVEPPKTFNNAGPTGNITFRGVHTNANILGAYLGCNGKGSPRGLEILEPSDDDPSFWLDHYRQYGTSPFYLGFALDTWDEAKLRAYQLQFTSAGCPTEQIGYWWQSEGVRGCYHYMDCRATDFGSTIEVMSRNNCTTSRPTSSANYMLSAASSGTPIRVSSFLGSPTLHCGSMQHVAMVVPNASATIAYYAATFGMSNVPPLRRMGATKYRMQTTNASAWWADLALNSGFSLRVYQPEGTQPSWWYDGLQRYGPSIHLISFAVQEVGPALQRFAQLGYAVLQRGECYAYIDSLQALGIVVELREC